MLNALVATVFMYQLNVIFTTYTWNSGIERLVPALLQCNWFKRLTENQFTEHTKSTMAPSSKI